MFVCIKFLQGYQKTAALYSLKKNTQYKAENNITTSYKTLYTLELDFDQFSRRGHFVSSRMIKGTISLGV